MAKGNIRSMRFEAQNEKTWIIHGREGYCDDFGCCEPYAAGEAIKRRQANGEDLSQEDIERIAQNFGCWVEWKEKRGEGNDTKVQ